MIVGLLGRKRCGKDTAGEYLVKKYGFIRYSLAGPIKKGCQELFGFTEEQVDGDKKEEIDKHWGVKPRTILQIMGTEIFQFLMPEKVPELKKIGRYFWIHRFLTFYEENKDKNICITDVRFKHEVKALRELKGFIIKIERGEQKNRDMHLSEQEIEQITDYDYLIKNNGSISDLHKNLTRKLDKIIDINV